MPTGHKSRVYELQMCARPPARHPCLVSGAAGGFPALSCSFSCEFMYVLSVHCPELRDGIGLLL